MTSYTSVEPPFSYNPGYKPTKSILKQRISTTSPSWLTRFSSTDSLPQTQSTSPQQRTFGYFRKLINSPSPTSPGNSQPPLSTTTTISSSSTASDNEHDELSPAELKRVRFSVNRMTTEYFPYASKGHDNETNVNNNNIDTNPTTSINNQHQSTLNNNDNTETTDPYQTTNHAVTTTPGKVISYYEAACKIKEEPLLDVFMASLLSHQQASTLTHVDLSNQVLTRRAMEPLADMMCLDFGLEKLTMKNCQLEDEALKVILHSLLVVNRVQHLDLSDNRKIQVNGFKYISIFIKNAACLETIDLSGTTPDKKSIQYISQALATKAATNGTTNTSKLTGLIMNNCNLRQQQLESLSNAIRRSSISYLSLRGNKINQQSAISIGVMLRDYDNSTGGTHGLQHLILDNNDIKQGVQYIAQALRRNQSLRRLSLGDCKLDIQSCVSIAEALKYNQSLESLNISSNPLCGDQQLDGINLLKQSLYCNHSLANLALADTGLGSEAAVALAECLPENTALCRLDLSRNPGIDLTGLLALLSGLKLNSNMVFLDVNVPANDRDMVKAQSEIAALCTKNAQTGDENKSRTPSLHSVDTAHTSITTTQATARLSLQERLAAVTKGKNSSRTNSIRSTSSIENISSTARTTATYQQSRRPKIQTNFDVEVSQVGLLEEMLQAEELDDTTTRCPDDTIKQVYLQCRKGLLNLNHSIPHLMESEQLVDLLTLNDRLTTAITRYEEFNKRHQYAPSLPPRTKETSTETAANKDEQSQPQLDAAAVTDEQRSTSPFEIGDDDDDDDDDEGANNFDGSSTKQTTGDVESDSKDIHELRKEKEMEEGEAFKHAKDMEP